MFSVSSETGKNLNRGVVYNDAAVSSGASMGRVMPLLT